MTARLLPMRVGVAIAATLGSSTGIAASVGASVAVNQIGKGRGHSVQALVDGATINSEGDVTVAANSNATIDGLSFAGAGAAAGSADGLGVALAGSGTAIKNKIKMTIGAAIQNGGDVQTDADVSVSATDDSKIKADAGAASLSIGAGSGAAGAGSVGVAIAENDIRNNVTATVDNGIVDAKALTLNATSTTKIDTFGLAGAVSVAVSSGGAGSAAGAGTEVTNTIENTIQASIQNDSDITTTDDVTLSATDHSTLETFAIGGSIAVSGSSSGGLSAAIGTVILNNDISNTVQAFIDDISAEGAGIDAGNNLLLTADSKLTLKENTAVAASLSANIAPAGASFSGAGARVDTTTTNTVEAFIRNADDVKVTDNTHLTATDNPTVHGTVGTGAGVLSAAGASVGVSTTDITIDNNVRTYIDDATVGSDDLTLSATSTPELEALAVATSVAVSIGGAGAGSEATATVKSDVEARIGSGSDITATNVSLAANSTDNVKADAYGASGGVVAIGAAVANVETRSTTQAHVTDATVNATDLSIDAMGDGKVDAAVTSIAGGVWASGSGNSANATVDSTVQAFVGDNADIDLGNHLKITATATPDADADALGVGGSVGLQVGYSEAIATVKPQTDAYIGNNSEIDASSLTLKAEQQLPGGKDAAHAEATGSGGALYGSVNAVYSEATNAGEVTAFVGDNSQLTIANDASITASGNSQQEAKADGYNGGILAVGANISHAESDLATEAYLATGVTISAQNLTIQAVGNDDNFAKSISGGGGVVSGRAAQSTTESKSSAKVRIEDGDATSGNVEIDIADQLTIKADQISEFNGKANSVNAAVVGGSGAATYHTVDSTAKVEVGVDTDSTKNNLVIEAGSVDIDATQTILKAELNDAAAEAASGGALDASAVISKTTIENTTLISLGDSSTSNGFDTRINSTGDMDLHAFNDVSVWDKAVLDSGGLISAAVSESHVRHKKNDAVIQIQDAELYGDSNVTMSALSNVRLDNRASASSYGVAGLPSAISDAKTDTQNLIQLKDGAYVRAEGDVTLLAGQDAAGNQNQIDLDARSNIWNNTAIPIDGPGKSKASVTLDNSIDIEAGATVESVLDVNLLAAEGSVESLGTVKSQDAYEAIASGITGASTVNKKHDKDDITSSSGVTIDGTVNVSIENKEFLTIDLDNSNKVTVDGQEIDDVMVSQSGGVGDIALSVESLSNNINTYILQLQELKATYAGDTSAEAGYQAQIDYWQAQLDEVGDASEVAYINVPDISAKVGDIRVIGDYLQGSGKLNSPGDAEIKITNNSPYYLRVNNLNVPEVEGGRILFNRASVTSNSDITNRNNGQTASFSEVTTAKNSDEPLIEVTNTFDPTFATQSNSTDAPDMEILGSVTNIKGTVRLANDEGSILVDGNLNAKTVDIKSGSDFVLNDQGTVLKFAPERVNQYNDTFYISNHGFTTGDQVFYSNGGGASIAGLTDARSYFVQVHDYRKFKLFVDADFQTLIDIQDEGQDDGSIHSLSLKDDLGFFHAGGDPRSHLANKAEQSESSSWQAAIAGQFDFLGQVAAGIHESLGLTANSLYSGSQLLDITPTGGGTIASNDIFINARYLNINGLIQSGQDQRTLTLSSSLDSEIATFQTNYENGNTSSHYLTLSDDTDGTGIDAKYNADTRKIEVDNVTVEGGYMHLTGHIISTGSGELRVMDGFGKIDINNETNYEMVINTIDAGGGGNETGVEGRLQIIDTAQIDGNGDALSTTYTRIGDHITKTTSSGQSSTLQNTRSTTYNPLAGQAYTWVTGQGTATETTKTYKSNEVFGAEVSSSKQTSSTTRYLDETPLLEGAFVNTDYAQANNLYEHKLDTLTTAESTLVSKETWKKTKKFLGITTSTKYYRRDTYLSGLKYINTHSYSASESIDINFIGQDTGEVSIDSDKTVYLGGSINNIGGTTTLKSNEALIANSIGNLVTSDSLSVTTGGQTTLYTDVDQLAFTSSGDVSIQDFQGDVTLSGASTSTGGIAITTEGSLLGNGAGSYDLSAHQIDLTSNNGSIGSASQLLRIDSSVKDDSSAVRLEAAGDIHLSETTGNLHLTSAKAGGDVNLTISGGLLDNNNSETTDPYSQAQLEGLWTDMGLTTDRSAQAIASFKQQAVGLYNTYWSYRNLSASTDQTGATVYTANSYDPNFSYSYSATAQAQLQAQGYSTQEISTLAADKTAEYHALHTLFSGGSTQLSGDDAQMATVINDLFLDSDFSGQDLTDINSYNPDWIETSYDVSTGQQAQLTQGSQWTLDQLTNTIRSSVFGSVTDTQSTVEEANIEAGGNVTINATGGLGHTAGSITISNWGSKDWSDLSEAEQTAFSYAERDDITYYDASGNVLDNPSLGNSAIAKIVISLKQDVDIDAKGELNITAGAQVFLGSEQDININQVSAGDLVRIKSADGVYNVATSSSTTNITGSDLILEAGTESIGTSSASINVSLGHGQHYDYYNGKLYLLSNAGNWEAAQAEAESLGGNLVTINDAAEEQWLNNTFNNQRLWIGLTDSATEGQFEWANGETVTYTNWASGQPDNYRGSEHYAEMNWGGTSQWNDVSLSRIQRGVIELDAKEYNGSLYLTTPTNTWENSQTIAESLGGNLVTINDAAEETWIKSQYSQRMWIGLTDKVTEGQYEWISGETSTYRNWRPGEPNNSGNEDYIEMNFSNSRQWNDNKATGQLQGLVELGGNADLVARAQEGVYISSQADLNVDTIYGGDAVELTSGGAIIDNNGAETNIKTNQLSLTANTVGESGDGIDISLSGEDATASVNASSGGYIKVSGDAAIDLADRTGQVTIEGDDGDNTITLLSSNGDPNSSLDVTVNGNGGDDKLIIETTRSEQGTNAAGNTPGTISGTGLGTIHYGNDVETVELPSTLVDDAATIDENTVVTLNVLGNDSDFFGIGTVTIDAINGTAIAVGESIQLASGAKVTLNADNTLSYDPDQLAAMVSGERFSYTVTNSLGTSRTATVDIDIKYIKVSGDTKIDLAGRTGTVTIEGDDGDNTITLFSSEGDLNASQDVIVNGNGGDDKLIIETTRLEQGADAGNTPGIISSTGLGTIHYSNETETVEVPFTLTDDVATTDDNATVTLNVLGNDSDFFGIGTVTIDAINGTAIAAGESLQLASGATITLNADNTLSYDPGQLESLAAGDMASEQFSYTATNSLGTSRTATVDIEINGIDAAPVTTDEYITINEEEAVWISPLDNDYDIDQGDSVSLASVNGWTNKERNRNNYTLKVDLDNTPDRFWYQADRSELQENETATHSIDYVVSDDAGNTTTATVHITIVGSNDAPTVNNETAITHHSMTKVIDLLSNDSDVDNDLADLSITAINGTDIAPGTTVTLPSGALITLHADYTVTYDPNGQFDGATTDQLESFTYTVNDGVGGIQTGNVEVTVQPGLFYEHNKDVEGPLSNFQLTSTWHDWRGSYEVDVTDSVPLENFAFIDADNDGDMDLFTFSAGLYSSAGVQYFENNGESRFTQITGSAHPLNDIELQYSRSMSAADLDGDGDLDLFFSTGSFDGQIGPEFSIKYLQNQGENGFVEMTQDDNPFSDINVDLTSAPRFGDVDGDGDLDAFLNTDREMVLFRNNDGVFEEEMNFAHPFNDRYESTLVFMDMDGDGDDDAFMAERDSVSRTEQINFYRNNNETFELVTGADNPFEGEDIGYIDSMIAVDADGDGDLDLIRNVDRAQHETTQRLVYYENTSSATVDDSTVVTPAHPIYAGEDSGTTTENALLTLNPLGNDTGEDGTTSTGLSITQVNGNDITVDTPITLDSGAQLTVNADNTFAYNPNGQFESLNQGETGSDSFTYTISDAQGSTSTATVNVTVEGEALLEQSQGENFTPNGVLNLDGSNDYVVINNSQSLDLTTAITVETWIKVDSFNHTWQAIVTKGDDSWRLHRNHDTNQLNFSITDVGSIVGSTNVNDGQWHHVAATYDGSKMVLYVDGEIDAQLDATGLIPTNDYRILLGKNDQRKKRQFNGQLDEVRLWSDARSQAEIQASMNHSLAGTEDGLVANWTFDEATGTTLTDKTGSDYSGTLLNGQNNNFVTDDSLVITPSFDALKSTVSTENRTLKLDGANDYVAVGATSQLDLSTTSTFTLESQVYSTSTDNNFHGIMGYHPGSLEDRYPGMWVYKETGIHFGFGDGVNWYHKTVNNVLTKGAWNHVAMTYDGTSLKLYVDAQEVFSTDAYAGKTLNTTQQIEIGKASSYEFKGQLDNAGVWNVARTQEELQTSMNGEVTGSESGLLGYWSFDEDSSTDNTIRDLSANGLHGTLINGQSNHVVRTVDEDIDGDGDSDRIIHNTDGTVQLYRNNGSSLIEQFGSDNPFEGITLKAGSSIAFGDVDNDGDTDAFAVNADGTLSYYQTQDGVMSRVTGSESPVDELTGYSDIMFVDLDGDGDLDLVLKDDLGLTNYLENL
ncbi:MAG: LamG-like jellyroll fold domain-containing protein [Cyanobacteria bacterium J06560_6]